MIGCVSRAVCGFRPRTGFKQYFDDYPVAAMWRHVQGRHVLVFDVYLIKMQKQLGKI